MNMQQVASPTDELGRAFEGLKGLLLPYAKHFAVKKNTAKEYSLVGQSRQNKQKRFGAVARRAGYVTFYLCPTLLQDASPGLKSRMKGSACVQFIGADDEAFEELAALLSKRYQSYLRDGVF